MPKKKPIAKRLDKLFDDIKHEEPSAEAKPRPQKRSATEQAQQQPALEASPLEKRARISRVQQSVVVAQTDTTLSLAFQAGQNSWATLQVMDEETINRKWSEDEQLLVKQVTDQLSLALENAHLFQETQRRAQEMTALAEVGREVSATLNLEIVLDKVAEHAKKLLNAETSAVYIPVPNSSTWQAFSAIGIDADSLKNTPLETGRGILGNIVLTKTGVIANNAAKQPGAVTIAGTEVNAFEHILGVPILSLNQVTGLMAVWRTGQGLEFNQNELEFLSSLAQQAAVTIENARLFNSTKQSELEFRALFSAMDDVLIVYDRDGRYIRIAPTNPKSLILPPEALLDKTIAEVLPEKLQKLFMDSIHEALDTNKLVRLEYPLEINKNLYWFDASVSKLGNDQVFWFARDITERKYNELTQAAITHITEGALTTTALQDLLEIVHEAVATLMPATDFFIAMYDESTDSISYPYYQNEFGSSGAHQKQLTGFLGSQKPGKGLTSYVLRTGKPLLCTPEIYAELERTGAVQGEDVRKTDWLGVPLRKGNQRFGVMALRTFTEDVRLTTRDRDSLVLLANQVALAIERIRSQGELVKFKLGIDQTDNAVFITDRQGSIEYVNPGFEKIYGYSYNEVLGSTPRILKSGMVSREEYQQFWNTLLSGSTISGEIINKTKDGRFIPILGTNSPILSDSGNVVGFLAVHQDITERKLSEQALQRRNAYLAASSEIGRLVTSTLDLNTIFTRTVSLISDRFGFYFAAIYILDETGFRAILREAKGEAGEKMKAQRYAISVGSQTIVGRVADTGQSKLANNISIEPLYQPNPLLLDTQSEVAIPLRVGERTVGVIDIQSKDLDAFSQDDLSVLQSLADQVAIAIDNAASYQRSQELVKELQEVDQLKSQFLANMSHELRTPLNSIIGFSRVILKGIDGPVTEMQHQDLTAIYNSGQHLLGLINDILDLARIEAGKMELNFEEVKLSEMVNSVLSTAKGLVKEKPIQLVAKIPADMPTVRGDTMRIRQVLINLLSNASKFTDEGTITVEALVQKGPNGKPEALINVIDTGPGITQEGQEKLFKAFSQVDGSATRKSGGSGLGLSICANLVQLHNGRISVHSAEGKGSTFWFTLPLFHQPVEEIPANKKVILAIDDDPQVTSLYERYLNPQGYHVVPLTDPSQAKARILELNPYAVTLDIMMPNIDGWTVLTTLKTDPETRHYPVVICSIMEQTDKGFNLGASDYLVKPILEEEIVNSINKLNKNGNIREVMVIDDDPNDLRLIDKILTNHGQYKAILVEGGRKGWEALNANPPDAIILDIFMPGMDGFTILEKLREHPVLREIPVLVVSGGGLTNEQHQQLADYGQRLITKGSLKEDELIASIENALKRIG